MINSRFVAVSLGRNFGIFSASFSERGHLSTKLRREIPVGPWIALFGHTECSSAHTVTQMRLVKADQNPISPDARCSVVHRVSQGENLFIYHQVVIIDPEKVRLRDEVIGLQARLDEVNFRLTETIADSLEQHRALEIESAAHEAAVIELRQVRRELDALLDARDEINRLRSELDRLYQSRTWRVGRLFLLPLRALRKMLGLRRKV